MVLLTEGTQRPQPLVPFLGKTLGFSAGLGEAPLSHSIWELEVRGRGRGGPQSSVTVPHKSSKGKLYQVAHWKGKIIVLSKNQDGRV